MAAGVDGVQTELEKQLRRDGLREQETPQRDPVFLREDVALGFPVTRLLEGFSSLESY